MIFRFISRSWIFSSLVGGGAVLWVLLVTWLLEWL